MRARSAGGKDVYAKAAKAVILAGSGFSNNRAMIKKYCPEVYEKAVGSFVPPSDTGEVVRMALGAGADLADVNSWTAFAGGIPFVNTGYTGQAEPALCISTCARGAADPRWRLAGDQCRLPGVPCPTRRYSRPIACGSASEREESNVRPTA